MKAIGATRRQIKKIVLLEGFGVAAIAIPAGLLLGTAIARIVMLGFLSFSSEENAYLEVMDEVIRDGEVTLCYWWIYLLVIAAMGITGVFLMIVATVLSCADPKESADSSIVGQYEIFPIVEDNNKEHPEWAWSEVQKSDLMNEKLKKQIEKLDGIKYVETFTRVRIECDAFTDGEYNAISGIPEAYAEEIEKGITEGEITYEELKSGDKAIVDRALLHWYPELGVGDRVKLTVHDGDRSYEKEVEIAAVGEYRIGLTDYDFFIMAKEAADKLCENNHAGRFCVMADQDYDEALEKSLKEIVDRSGRLQMRTWKTEYTLLLIQILLAFLISRSARKDSLIERIRI